MGKLNLNDEVITAICSYVIEGICYRDAYLLSNVSKYTGSNWRKQALKDKDEGINAEDSIYVRLLERMENARAQYRRSLVQKINVASDKDWKAAMTMLERTDPDTYSREHKLVEYRNIKLDVENQTPSQMIQTLLTAVLEGKISSKKAQDMADIISKLIQTEENGELKRLLDVLDDSTTA